MKAKKKIYKTIENKNNHISSLKQSNGDLKSAKSKLETKIRNFEKKILKTVVSSATQTCCTSDALFVHTNALNSMNSSSISSSKATCTPSSKTMPNSTSAVWLPPQPWTT